jgi:hypothetical protein
VDPNQNPKKWDRIHNTARDREREGPGDHKYFLYGRFLYCTADFYKVKIYTIFFYKVIVYTVPKFIRLFFIRTKFIPFKMYQYTVKI